MNKLSKRFDEVSKEVAKVKAHYKWNPKVIGSGLIACIPQAGLCPNKCDDCFFQSGRSYLEPLKENLPNIPSIEEAKDRIVRINDGNDSNNQRELVEKIASQFPNYFFNTANPTDLDKFSGPVVFTANPGPLTDDRFIEVDPVPDNLMYVRIRTNRWNISNVVFPAVDYYTLLDVPVVLTFMAYYTESIPEQYKRFYEWKKRTLNSYWCLRENAISSIMQLFSDNPLVYSCGVRGQHSCRYCGNCVREYYVTKERMRTK